MDYKMPLGMEVGLGPDDFVFDGDPATSSIPTVKNSFCNIQGGGQPPF